MVYATVLTNETVKAAFIPLAPGYGSRLGLSQAEIGLVLAISSIATTVFSVPFGVLADRLNARTVLLGATALLMLTALAQGSAESLSALLVARAAFGAASAAIWVAATAWLASTVTVDSRWGQVGGIVAMAGAGSLLGPALAGALARPSTPGTAFLVLAAPVAIVGLISLRVVPPGPRATVAPSERPPAGTVWRLAMAEPLLVAAVLIQVVGGLAESTANLLAPLALHADGVSLEVIGVVVSVSAGIFLAMTALCATAGSWLISTRAAGLGMLLLACSLVPFLLPRSVTAVEVGVLLRMPFLGFLYTMGFPLASAGAERWGVGAGTMIAVVNTLYGAAVALGPLAAGAAAGAVPDQAIYALIAALALGSSAWVLGATGARPAAAAGFASTRQDDNQEVSWKPPSPAS